MAIQLEIKDLIKAQQMEVAVNGPDGATHLILCTGIVQLIPIVSEETYIFPVGPQFSRRQFVGAIVSGALSLIRAYDNNSIEDISDVKLEANLISIEANYEDEVGQVQVRAEVSSSNAMTRIGISYNVNILAELPIY